MFDPHWLANELDRLARRVSAPSRYLVGFSGGLDSTALLHALQACGSSVPIVALHVDHGLHADSAEWARHAAMQAERFGVGFERLTVSVDRQSGDGPEAAARTARYAALATRLEDGDWLLTAQHRDDQAETVLLNLLRGSGPRGLAAMPRLRTFGSGWLVRPLLDVDSALLAQYARSENLQWLQDPSNDDPSLDRNYLRLEILPRLRLRWPAADRRLARSADLAADASRLLDELAALDLTHCATESPQQLALQPLTKLEVARRRNLLRYACRTAGLVSPPEQSLQSIATTVIEAAEDRCPTVAWPGGQVHRYRNRLYLSLADPSPRTPFAELRPGRPVDLGPGLGTLRLEAGCDSGLPAAVANRGLTILFRQGGEKLRPDANGRRRQLKTLFQEAGILPWMRPYIPLLWADARLVAVGDLWLDAAFREPGGFRVRWSDRPTVK